MKLGVECVAFKQDGVYMAYSLEHPVTSSSNTLVEAQQILSRQVQVLLQDPFYRPTQRRLDLLIWDNALQNHRPIKETLGLRIRRGLTALLSIRGMRDYASWRVNAASQPNT